MPVSTTAVTRAVLSSGVGLALEQAPLVIVGDPGIPTPATTGLGVRAGLLTAVLAARCRMDPARRRAWGVVTSVVSGDDYRVDVDGTDVTYTAGVSDDAAAILDGLRLAIEGDVTLAALVEATVLAVGPAGNVPHLLLVARDDTDWTVLFDVDAGTGTMDTYAEPTSMEIALYARPRAVVPTTLLPVGYGADSRVDGWTIATGAGGPVVDLAVGVGGVMERVDVSGLAALYVQPHTLAGPTGEDPSVQYVTLHTIFLGVS
jgi:hypothetical protein